MGSVEEMAPVSIEEKENEENTIAEKTDEQALMWQIEDKPPIPLCLFLGFQVRIF